MTVLGKVLVVLTTLLSLFGLSMALWSFSEESDLQAKAKTISDEIQVQRGNIEMEFRQLQTVLQQASRGERPMPYDPADPFAREQTKTVKQVRDEVASLEKDLNDAEQLWNKSQQELIVLVNEMSRLRAENRDALAEQKRLRETITPDRAVNPQALPLRDVTRAAWASTVEADRRITEARPTLVSEVMLLMSLQQRFDKLKQRAEELKLKQPASSAEAAAHAAGPR